MEEQAQKETVGAEEAYLLLGDAEVTVSLLLLLAHYKVRSNLETGKTWSGKNKGWPAAIVC